MISLFDVFAPIQLLAWASAVLYVLSYQQKTSQKTIIFWAPADVLMAIHFIFMSAPLFLITAIGGTFRSLIAVYLSKRSLGLYLIMYLVVLVAAYFLLSSGLKEAFAVFGTLSFSLSVWFKESFLWHRGFAFCHQLSWIAAYVLLESYGGLALMIFMFASNAIGTSRYLLNQKGE